MYLRRTILFNVHHKHITTSLFRNIIIHYYYYLTLLLDWCILDWTDGTPGTPESQESLESWKYNSEIIVQLSH